MKKIIDKLKDVQWLGKLACGIIGALITGIWFIFSTYRDFKDDYEELLGTVKTTQQMALKSVIWNEAIPLAERESACDVYLNAGYNSMTKKECEVILEEKWSELE